MVSKNGGLEARRQLAASVALGLSLGLAGCSSDGDDDSGAGTAGASMSGSGTSGGAGGSVAGGTSKGGTNASGAGRGSAGTASGSGGTSGRGGSSAAGGGGATAGGRGGSSSGSGGTSGGASGGTSPRAGAGGMSTGMTCDDPADCADGEYCVFARGGMGGAVCSTEPVVDPPLSCCFTCDAIPVCTLCRTEDDCPATFICVAAPGAPNGLGGCRLAE